MDTSDRHDSILPARSHSNPLPLPMRSGASLGGVSRELVAAPPPSMQVSPVGILRGLLRNWWKILGIWLILSVPLVYLIYTQVKPTYRAYSRIEIKTNQPDLFGSTGPMASTDRLIETEMSQMKSPNVLAKAVADESTVDLPLIRSSKSPAEMLQNKLSVVNERNTNIVVLSLESPEAYETAAIVNAVMRAYIEDKTLLDSSDDAILKKSLDDYLKSKRTEKANKVRELTEMMERGTVDPKSLLAQQSVTKGGGGTNRDDKQIEVPSSVTFEQYRRCKDDLLTTQVKLFETRAQLARRSEGFQNPDEVEQNLGGGPSEAELNEMIKAEFRNDAAIADLYAQREDIGDRLEHVEGTLRNKGSNDPARRQLQDALAKIDDRISKLWFQRYPDIKRRILASGGERPTADPSMDKVRSVRELRAEVEALEDKQKALLEVLNTTEVENKESNSDTFKAQFLQAEIDAITNDIQVVDRKLQDLKFRTDREALRVKMLNEATVPLVPSETKRYKLMAAVPIAIMALLLGLFSLLEIKAERVADPDALSSRVQSEVYSLPPLPMARRLGAGGGGDDHIDRFIQRLDHLRFAVCGDNPEVGLGRCVLISSAVGGEGKTTLAAQLAARCGNSGHSTLLIDADLRRGTLGTLLDIPECVGLSDVLTNPDINVEDVVIPVQGGTFHLLSAGTAVPDASRVFQGRSFGILIARLRQLYDLIIIDSPPILPVPDALIMGRWTDGVVLASRYDVSRAPQVERARRQVDLAGIPVLGTVINGMRTADSYYGRYTYSRHSNDPADPAPTS